MPPIDAPVSDTSRGVQHNPDQDWPESVKLQICWRDSAGRASVSTQIISANQFFGRGEFQESLLVLALERVVYERIEPINLAKGFLFSRIVWN